MNVRSTYEQELASLQDEVFNLGKEVIQTFERAMELLDKGKGHLLQDIIDYDKVINKKELEIHDKATLMIAKQQPVATDLRTTIVALKISSDLERVGDLSIDIIKASRRMTAFQPEHKIEEMREMASIAVSMLDRALSAYKHKDLMTAQQIAVLDDKVDAKYKMFVRGLFAMSIEQNEIENIAQLAFIGRYIERIADYATNLAEWIVYEQNGQHFDLN
ncbi:PhoU-like phosphate uptake regulator [Sinobaca qinghaiensis]|uniref:Phosphate-specific transport system accessory protein PhoU n=1 Tax=Sinobaca qinghaiensis TaxID=342944 RepID=A0A419V6P1_9BACL|nr:phosphate signaling complex protein PhoU [Sinobaca qinghaiensis]RKD75655.1 PhoU-like phosphate uptake regulator [Sinobaca qinghaiensis]